MTMTEDFFRKRLDQLIDLLHTLAVLFNRMPWQKIEASLFTALPGKYALARRSKALMCLAPPRRWPRQVYPTQAGRV
jgi:hypothetical protein